MAADAGFGREVSPTRWTRTDVYHVLRCDIPNWCSLHSCLWPVELPEAMWEWFDFLADTGRLDPASDPLWELRKPLLCYGGLDEQRTAAAGADDAAHRGVRVPPALPGDRPAAQPPGPAVRVPRAEPPGRAAVRWSARGRDIPGPEELDAMLRDLRDDMRDIESGGIPGFPYDEGEESPWL